MIFHWFTSCIMMGIVIFREHNQKTEKKINKKEKRKKKLFNCPSSDHRNE